jgi:hypothetical protein
MTDPRLLVPLSALPGPVPVGVWLWDSYAQRHAIVTGSSPEGLLLVYADTLVVVGRADDDVALWLDLSPPDPPLSHVDGLDVGLRMLGWEPGCSAAAIRHTAGGVNLYVGRRSHGDVRQWCATEVIGGGYDTPVPDLANIDPADPLALRLAVAAVLRAGGAR